MISDLWTRVKNWLAQLGPRRETRLFWRMFRQDGKPWWQFVHGYAYGRWPYKYIGSAIGGLKSLRRWRVVFAPFLIRALSPERWANGYHGKTVRTEDALRLVNVQEDVALPQSESVIPFSRARDLVLRQPDHIVVLDCPCRLARKNPCLPLDVCLIIGEPFASFVLAHHPEKARAIKVQEAEDILQAEAERGHVHQAFFNEAMADRFYAICNCCSCCCGAMQAYRSGSPMVISSGYLARVDAERCQACGLCAERCPFDAITIHHVAIIDAEACMGCGVCVTGCEAGAIELLCDETKPEPLQIP